MIKKKIAAAGRRNEQDTSRLPIPPDFLSLAEGKTASSPELMEKAGDTPPAAV